MPLIDLFVAPAPPRSAASDSLPKVPPQYHPDADRIDIKGTDVSALAALWSVLDPAVAPDTAFDAFALVCESEDCVVMALPEPLVRQLEAMTQDDVARVAKRWSRVEELGALAARAPGAIEEALARIVALARRARIRDARVYVWMSP